MIRPRILSLLQRGYSDDRISELVNVDREFVTALRFHHMGEPYLPLDAMAPRSRGPEQGAERLDGRETYATQTLSGG